MSVEIHVFTSREFIRLGAHGEVDWQSSVDILRALAKAFVTRGVDHAILDVRDASALALTDEQLVGLVEVLHQAGFRPQHRLAVLHRPRPNPKADIFADAAILGGFDVESFDDYERAVEWLSMSREKDPDFDREIYKGPSDKARPDGRSPPDGPKR